MDCEKVSYSSSFCMAFRKPKQSLLVTKENFVYLVELRWHFQFQICLLWGVIILACLEDFRSFLGTQWIFKTPTLNSFGPINQKAIVNYWWYLSSKKIFPFSCKVILILPIAIFHHFFNNSKPWVKCHKRNRRHHSEKVFLNIFTSWGDDIATWIMLMLESKSRPSILIAIIKAPLLSWET